MWNSLIIANNKAVQGEVDSCLSLEDCQEAEFEFFPYSFISNCMISNYKKSKKQLFFFIDKPKSFLIFINFLILNKNQNS